jgi:hypothetical protein
MGKCGVIHKVLVFLCICLYALTISSCEFFARNCGCIPEFSSFTFKAADNPGFMADLAYGEPAVAGVGSSYYSFASNAEGVGGMTQYNFVLSSQNTADITKLVPTLVSNVANAAFSPASGQAMDFSNPVEYTIRQEGAGIEATRRIAVRRASANECDILQFYFDSSDNPGILAPDPTPLEGTVEGTTWGGTIDNDANTILFEYGHFDGLELTLRPKILLSIDATVSPASLEVQDFSQPVQYTVTALDGTTRTYTVKLVAVERYTE